MRTSIQIKGTRQRSVRFNYHSPIVEQTILWNRDSLYDNRQTVMGNRKKQLNGWDHEKSSFKGRHSKGAVATVTLSEADTFA